MEQPGFKEFIMSLRLIAKLSKTDLDPDVLAFYDKALAPYGYLKVAAAIEGFANESLTRLPSVNQIKAALGVTPLNNQQIAEEAVGRIKQAINKFGLPSAVEAMEYIGPAGRHIVRCSGGWSALCAAESWEEISFALKDGIKAALPAITNGHDDFQEPAQLSGKVAGILKNALNGSLLSAGYTDGGEEPEINF